MPKKFTIQLQWIPAVISLVPPNTENSQSQTIFLHSCLHSSFLYNSAYPCSKCEYKPHCFHWGTPLISMSMATSILALLSFPSLDLINLFPSQHPTSPKTSCSLVLTWPLTVRMWAMGHFKPQWSCSLWQAFGWWSVLQRKWDRT